MKKIIIPALTLLMLTILGVTELQAQTTVTFNINLKPQLEDSVFVPGRGDYVEVTGNQYPLGGNRTVRLRDREPVDSVFTAEVRFPSNVQGNTLQYNFILETSDKTWEEQMYRQLNLRGGKIMLDALYFDSYAW